MHDACMRCLQLHVWLPLLLLAGCAARRPTPLFDAAASGDGPLGEFPPATFQDPVAARPRQDAGRQQDRQALQIVARGPMSAFVPQRHASSSAESAHNTPCEITKRGRITPSRASRGASPATRQAREYPPGKAVSAPAPRQRRAERRASHAARSPRRARMPTWRCPGRRRPGSQIPRVRPERPARATDNWAGTALSR